MREKKRRKVSILLAACIGIVILLLFLPHLFQPSDWDLVKEFQEIVKTQDAERLYDLCHPRWRSRYDRETAIKLLREGLKILPRQFNIAPHYQEHRSPEEIARFYKAVPNDPFIKPFTITVSKDFKSGRWYLSGDLFYEFLIVQYGFAKGNAIWRSWVIALKGVRK